MSDRGRFERRYRRAVVGGILLSVAAHGALFAWGRLRVRVPDDPGSALRVVALPSESPAPDPSPPMQVVRIRELPASSAAGGAGGATAPAAEAVPSLAVPEIASVAAELHPIAEEKDEESPAEAYAKVSDFLVETGASPKPFRPIDGRPVDVLGRIGAGRGTGVGVGVGGGHCPPPNRAPVVRRSATVQSHSRLLQPEL